MNHPQTPTPLSDISSRFVYDDKNDSERLVSTDSTTAHDPHGAYPHPSVFDSESDEETPAHATPSRISTSRPNQTHHASSPPARADHIQVQDEPILTDPDRTSPRVRFRSRVRISAGMGRRRRRPSDGPSSNTSSLSGSPSSSISAPLRTHYTGENGWGPLGSRLNTLASQATQCPPSRGECANGGKGNAGGGQGGNARAPRTALDDDVDEHTHLMTPSAARRSYVGSRHARDRYHDDSERERRWREQLIDEAFGKWPERLLNRRWWWWYVESILCCFCGDEEQE